MMDIFLKIVVTGVGLDDEGRAGGVFKSYQTLNKYRHKIYRLFNCQHRNIEIVDSTNQFFILSVKLSIQLS